MNKKHQTLIDLVKSRRGKRFNSDKTLNPNYISFYKLSVKAGGYPTPQSFFNFEKGIKPSVGTIGAIVRCWSDEEMIQAVWDYIIGITDE